MSDQPMNDQGDFYEAAFHLMTPAGVLVRYTVHSNNANECMKRQEFIIKNRLDGGYTVPAGGAASGNAASGGNKTVEVESQTYTGFMIKVGLVKGKKATSIELPFNLNNGESAAYPHSVFGKYAEMFLKSIADAGIEAETGEFYEIPIRATWVQGKEMPKKDGDDPNAPPKHYKNWQTFEVLQSKPTNPPAKKPPVNQPPPSDDNGDIPF